MIKETTMRQFVIAIALACSAFQARASDWVDIGGRSTSGVRFEIDRSSIKQQSGAVWKAWVKTIEPLDDERPKVEAQVLFEINCNEDTSRVLTSVSYVNGKVSNTPKNQAAQMTPIPPDSVLWVIRDRVCIKAPATRQQ